MSGFILPHLFKKILLEIVYTGIGLIRPPTGFRVKKHLDIFLAINPLSKPPLVWPGQLLEYLESCLFLSTCMFELLYITACFILFNVEA